MRHVEESERLPKDSGPVDMTTKTEPQYEYKPVDWGKHFDEFGRPIDPDLRLYLRAVGRGDVGFVPVYWKGSTVTSPFEAFNINEVFERHEVEKLEPIPIPDCVPDGSWLFGRRGLFGDHHFLVSPGDPRGYESHPEPPSNGMGHSEEYFLNRNLFPELYAWKGPVEDACVQVDRSRIRDQSKDNARTRPMR